jgi:hypothetical protein
MWEPSQATSDKDINGLVLLASAGCRLFGERIHRETVYVLCGGKGTAPGCALHGSPKVPSVMEALYRKDAGEVAKLLGRGLDLTCLVPPGGHTSALLTMAMLKDHDRGHTQHPVQVSPEIPVSRCLSHIFTIAGQS